MIADILGHFGSLTPLPGDGGLNVITHQVEIVMARTIREVNGSRAGGQSVISQPCGYACSGPAGWLQLRKSIRAGSGRCAVSCGC